MKKKELTAKEMIELANDKTDASMTDARFDREDAWLECVKDLRSPYLPTDKENELEKYATSGIFLDATNYFKNRTSDLLEHHHYSNYNFASSDLIIAILSFNFNYDYDRYEWNEKDYNPDIAFDTDTRSETLDFYWQKQEMCEMLRTFLLTGGALAKSINSDTYGQWRKLLVDDLYVFDDFDEGCDRKKTEAFMADIQTAARLLCADFAFAEAEKNLSHNTSKKDKKRAK